nr:exopolyphosphatase [Pedobacter sp. ASV19]
MRAAVIDLGTNTFHLIIADLSNRINVVYKTNSPVKLGEGKINENIIIPEAFERGLQTLISFAEEIKNQQVDVVRATATSAVRSAANGADFVKAAKLRAGIDIEVISGEEEAGYIFMGVQATGVIVEPSLIMDIGGGSTEFILCNPEQVLWKKSYNIGAARLMQAYFKSDPISEADKNIILDHLENTLRELKEACAAHQPLALIGSAGAFETFATLLLKDVEVKEIASCTLPMAAYKKLAAELIASTHEERAGMKGLIPLRVDMIVLAAILTNYVINEIGLEKLSLSTYDLKMGVLQSLLPVK